MSWAGNGADANFSTVLNWTNGLAPAYVGDSLQFAGTKQLAPNLDNNYTVTGVLFDSSAGAFNLGSTGGYTLTLTNGSGVVNSSTKVQTLSAAVALGSSQTFNAAADDLVVSGVIADGSSPGGLTKTGTHALTLSGANTYSGPTMVNGGTLNITGSSGGLAANTFSTFVGNVAGNAVLNISGSTALSAYYLLVGNVAGSMGAVYQTGGTLTATASSGYDNLAVGNVAGGYGYYAASGGTATVNGICIGGENNQGPAPTLARPAVMALWKSMVGRSPIVAGWCWPGRTVGHRRHRHWHPECLQRRRAEFCRRRSGGPVGYGRDRHH